MELALNLSSGKEFGGNDISNYQIAQLFLAYPAKLANWK